MTSAVDTTVQYDYFAGRFCDLGYDADLAVTAQVDNRCTIKSVKYYIRSLPNTKGKVTESHPFALAFQEACDEWKSYSGINFERVKEQDGADFLIRTANSDEETEQRNMIARAFFWTDSKQKRVIVWKSIENWDPYAVFLHEVGHILGFRHEHVFLPDDERVGVTATDETKQGVTLLQSCEVDK